MKIYPSAQYIIVTCVMPGHYRSTVTEQDRGEEQWDRGEYIGSMNWAAEGIYKMITKRNMSRRNNDASPVFLHLGHSLVAVVRDDPLSAGTVSLMAAFSVLSTGALCGANGPRRLFITSALTKAAGMFCFCCYTVTSLMESRAADVHVSHPSV